MSKKVLILSGSPRKGANSDTLCDEFMRGAREAGNETEKVFICDLDIGGCKACFGCHGTGKCVINDGMAGILEKMHWADVIVMASPVYFYSISSQMKALIDRTFCQWTQLHDKEFYYIMTAADKEREAMDTALACFRGFAYCLKNAQEKGVIYGNGLFMPDSVRNTTYMQEAYEMGKNI